MRWPILIIHITGGTLGMLSGFLAVFLRKGSRPHALAGRVFVASMLTSAVCGSYLAWMLHQADNVAGGILTFYLVATAWLTARRRDAQTGILDWAAFLIVLAVAVVTVTLGLEAAKSPTGMKYGSSAGSYFFLSSIALLAAVGDVRMLVRGSISGTPRLARHLWRMCFALFIAAASIFLARQQLFPAFMHKTGMLFALSFLPLALLIFWMIRVRLTHASKQKTIGSHAPLIQSLVEKRV